MPPMELESWLMSLEQHAQECPSEVSKSGKAVYDESKDLFMLLLEPSKHPGFELPDPDGDCFWLFARDSNSIVGIGVFRATQKDTARLASKIVAKTEWFEKKLSESSSGSTATRLTRFAIERLQKGQTQELSKDEDVRKTELAYQLNRLIPSAVIPS